MAHYAFLDSNNIVTGVIVGKDETDTSHNWEEYYGNFHGYVCKRTSYNTYENKHLLGGTPFRKNYAGIGMTYDASKDAFIPIKPYPSWVLDEATCTWKAPTSYPTDGKHYVWDESTTAWVEETLLNE